MPITTANTAETTSTSCECSKYRIQLVDPVPKEIYIPDLYEWAPAICDPPRARRAAVTRPATRDMTLAFDVRTRKQKTKNSLLPSLGRIAHYPSYS